MQKFKRVENYIIKEEIGRGNFSTVFSAIKENTKSPNLYAIKCISKNSIENNSILKNLLISEASIMKQINHPNIIHCHEFYETKNNYYLILDYCDKKDLETFVQKLNVKYLKENEAISVLKQIIKGLRILRKYDIIHRDLKLSNIFLHENRILIGDFGMAKVGKQMSGTTVGTPINMAPEMIQGTDNQTKVDIWALGVIFYKLLFGSDPFFGLSLNELFQSIKNNSGEKLKFPSQQKITEKSQELLRKMLEFDWEKRIEWKELFNHEYFVKKPKKSDKENQSQKAKSFQSDDSVETKENLKQSLEMKKIVVEEEKVLQTDLQSLYRNLDLKELVGEYYGIYKHELKKVNFFLKLCKEIAVYLFETKKEENVHYFQIMHRILNMAEIMNEKIKFCLLERKNFLNLENFEKFVVSHQYELLIDEFNQKSQELEKFKNIILSTKCFQNLLENFPAKEFLQGQKKENYLFVLLQEEVKKIFSTINFKGNEDKNFLLMNVKIILTCKIQKLLEYWNGIEKFNWIKFENSYEIMSNLSLIEIIKLSNEEQQSLF